jgi:hypothetical protein
MGTACSLEGGLKRLGAAEKPMGAILNSAAIPTPDGGFSFSPRAVIGSSKLIQRKTDHFVAFRGSQIPVLMGLDPANAMSAATTSREVHIAGALAWVAAGQISVISLLLAFFAFVQLSRRLIVLTLTHAPAHESSARLACHDVPELATGTMLTTGCR